MQDKPPPNNNEERSPAPPLPQEQTSEHAPLPIGCSNLDPEQQRLWDNFYRQGQARDKAREEARQQREAMREQEQAQTPEHPKPKPAQPPLSPMERFRRSIAYRTAPTYRKVNLPPASIAQYLRVAYETECNARHQPMVMDNYTANTIGAVARWLSSESHTKGSLLLRGYVGVGKTTMLRSVSTLFIGLGLGGFRIVSAFNLAELAKDKDAFQGLCKSDYLGIDDLGQEPNTIKDYGNERSPFEELISARYDHLKQTLISTNLVIEGGRDQIADRYGTRVADRLREMCNTINYGPAQKSYRI
jgi:DNA replication protein DnaC